MLLHIFCNTILSQSDGDDDDSSDVCGMSREWYWQISALLSTVPNAQHTADSK